MSKPTNREEIERYFSTARIKCLVCKKEFKALGTHLTRMHKMTADEYKEKYGLPWGRGLVCPDSWARYSDATLSRPLFGGASKEDMEKFRQLAHKASQRKRAPFILKEVSDRWRYLSKISCKDKKGRFIRAKQLHLFTTQVKK